MIGIRNKLKDWAKENDFFFEVAMNPIATRVIENDMRLKSGMSVFINDDDINLIADRFDTYEERLMALAILCYAKLYADDNGVLKLSQSSISHWTKLNRRTVAKYMKVLEDLEYITKEEQGETKSWYSTTVITLLDKYRVCVPLFNVGYFEINDNDIVGLYHRIFSGIDDTYELWNDIPEFPNYQISNLQRVRVKDRFVSGRHFKAKILRPFISKSGKIYYNLSDEKSKQVKRSVDFLTSLAFKK